MGLTPVGMARKFGPHREIEGELGSVMLDKNFAEKYALSQGRRSLVANSNPEQHKRDGGTNDTLVESAVRQAELTAGNVGVTEDVETSHLAAALHTFSSEAPPRERSQQWTGSREGARSGQGEMLAPAMAARFDAMEATTGARLDAMEDRFMARLALLEQTMASSRR